VQTPKQSPNTVLALVRVRQMVASGQARMIREAAGLSLAELASAVGPGVSPTTVWRWEAGERQPRGDAAIAYGRLLVRLEREVA